ncbi:hypothetical protein P43SY_007588 [Pythium insidiosum]|uniref:Tyrosine specific protein phosphatases domain-containing protein n=1 Tax=Pythium insidiosum TaxID=114742 RepID=A0AAD5M5X5_PYTIN|nr:hypothetical protein P43SY_007588 [Pythium insidiosum]
MAAATDHRPVQKTTPFTDRGARHKKSKKKKVSIPDNWADVPKMGSRVASSRFVALRVPLDDKYTHLTPSRERWTPAIFVQDQASMGYNIRLVIDLTNTSKYYEGETEFAESPIEYAKLRIEGFKSAPRLHDVEQFAAIVDDFVSRVPDGNIAVHCTHGLNRTGFLIVSYLVERCDFTLQEALQAFSDARPPGLIKHMYIEELYRRFAPGETPMLPELPGWAAAKYGARAH